jgi:hypothetical protein
MNIATTHRIMMHVSNIAALAATFQAKYGRDYRLNNDSPAQAWELYRQLMAEQTNIAAELETIALESPYSRYGKWWERRDVIDSGLLNELSAEAMTLVERCAYLNAMEQSTENAPSLVIVQQSIAGMLHPATRPMSVSNDVRLVQEAS